MIKEFIDQFMASIAAWFGGLFVGIEEYFYIGEWWLVALGVLVAALVVGFFLPWNWVRAVLGFIAWSFLVAALAATKVWRYMRRKRTDDQ